MLRRVFIVSTTCWCFLASCVSTNDDEPASTGGRAGASTGGKGGRGGTNSVGGTTTRTGGTGNGASAGSEDAGASGDGGGGSDNEGGAPTAEGGTTARGGTSSDGGTTSRGGSSTQGGSNSLGGSTNPAQGGTTLSGGSGGAPPAQGGGGAGGEGGDDLGGAGGDTTEPPVDTSGLVVRYAFDEGSGTTSADVAGHFAAANLVDGATWKPGRAGTSGVELAASTAHVVLPPRLFPTVQAATIATWVNVAAHNPWSRIFDFNAGLTKFIFLASDRGTEGPLFTIHTGVPEQNGEVGAIGHLPLGVWKHVAVTVSGPNYTMFVDGYPVANVVTNARFPAEIEPSTVGWLGRSTFVTDAYLKAKLDDFRVYDKALTQTQIADLAWPDNDYSYLRFDEVSGSSVTDSSNRHMDGTLVNGATFVPGRLGNAVQLTASQEQYVALKPDIMTDCNDVTVAMWAKLGSSAAYTRLLDIDGLLNGFIFFTPTAMVNVQGVGAHPELRFNIYRPGQPVVDQMVSAPYPANTTLVGEWHHFAVTLSGQTARLYFDGREIGSNPEMTFDPSQIDIAPTGAHAWIGRSTIPTDPKLDAAVDEVRISCRAFSGDEIAQLAR